MATCGVVSPTGAHNNLSPPSSRAQSILWRAQHKPPTLSFLRGWGLWGVRGCTGEWDVAGDVGVGAGVGLAATVAGSLVTLELFIADNFVQGIAVLPPGVLMIGVAPNGLFSGRVAAVVLHELWVISNDKVMAVRLLSIPMLALFAAAGVGLAATVAGSLVTLELFIADNMLGVRGKHTAVSDVAGIWALRGHILGYSAEGPHHFVVFMVQNVAMPHVQPRQFEHSLNDHQFLRRRCDHIFETRFPWVGRSKTLHSSIRAHGRQRHPRAEFHSAFDFELHLVQMNGMSIGSVIDDNPFLRMTQRGRLCDLVLPQQRFRRRIVIFVLIAQKTCNWPERCPIFAAENHSVCIIGADLPVSESSSLRLNDRTFFVGPTSVMGCNTS